MVGWLVEKRGGGGVRCSPKREGLCLLYNIDCFNPVNGGHTIYLMKEQGCP